MTDCPTLSLPEVARILGRHPETLYAWRRAGKMPFPVLEINGRPRVYRPQLEEFLSGAKADAS